VSLLPGTGAAMVLPPPPNGIEVGAMEVGLEEEEVVLWTAVLFPPVGLVEFIVEV